MIAEAPDVPGAMTVGKDRAEALERLQDALVLMLSGCVGQSKPIPRPSKPRRGQSTVSPPPLVTAKLALYQVMRRRGISQAQLAARLGCDLRQIRRLLDLDHPSKVEQIETVLRALGKRLVLDVRSAA